MDRHRDHNAPIFGRIVRIVILAFFVVLLAAPAFSQERRGDKPVRNSGKLRETRMKTRDKKGDRPRTRDVAGRRVRTKNKSSAIRANAAYPSPKAARAAAKRRDGDKPGKPVAPIMGTRPRDSQKAWSDGIFGRRVHVRSATGKARNVYSNRPQLQHLRAIQREPGDYGRGKKRVIPRSASRAFIRHTSINPIARFARKHKRGDQARLTDPAGRMPRGKNYRTPPQPIVNQPDTYRGRKRIGDDRPYRGPVQVLSSGIRAPRAWKGDISGRRIRGSKARPNTEIAGHNPRRIIVSPRFGDRRTHPWRRGTGYMTATESGEKRPGKALPAKAPGIGILGVGGITVRAKNQTPLTPHRAGKSRSGKMWNNQGNPLPARQPSAASLGAATFKGNTKWRPPLTPRRAGKSRSGELWNNQGRPLERKPATSTDIRAAAFHGNVKWRPPLTPRRAGKSRSGILWNNKEQPLPRKPPTSTDLRAGAFQGNMRLKRPLEPRRAGESKGREHWNNDGMPLVGKAPPRSIRTQAIFHGNIKGGRPLTPRTAGKSVSGELWNNKETPIKSKPPSDVHVAAFRYKGNVRLSRFGSRSYVRNPNAADDALKKTKPEKNTFDVSGIRSRMVAYRYVRNPSSSEDALKVRQPGRAFASVSAYQGNIRMSRFKLFSKSDLHPDSRFVKINKNNVKGEKDALTGFRLWWTRTFKKNDSQPEHLKQKVGKPRYDKGEEGLWYD